MSAVLPAYGGAAAAPHAVSGGGEGWAAGLAGAARALARRRGQGATGGVALTLPLASRFTPSDARRVRVAR